MVFACGHVGKRRRGTVQFVETHPLLPNDAMPRAAAQVQHLLPARASAIENVWTPVLLAHAPARWAFLRLGVA